MLRFAVGLVLVVPTVACADGVAPPSKIERKAIEHLRAIEVAQAAFRKQGSYDYARDYSELQSKGLLSGRAPKAYRFEVAAKGMVYWMAIARPAKAGKGRVFGINHAGVVHTKGKHPFVLEPKECLLPFDATPVITPPSKKELRGPLGNELKVIAALEQVWEAQVKFRGEDVDKDGKRLFAKDLKDLVACKLLPPKLARARHLHYAFEYYRSKTHPQFYWVLIARPLKPGRRGKRQFAITYRGWVLAKTPAEAKQEPFKANDDAQCFNPMRRVTGLHPPPEVLAHVKVGQVYDFGKDLQKKIVAVGPSGVEYESIRFGKSAGKKIWRTSRVQLPLVYGGKRRKFEFWREELVVSGRTFSCRVRRSERTGAGMLIRSIWWTPTVKGWTSFPETIRADDETETPPGAPPRKRNEALVSIRD